MNKEDIASTVLDGTFAQKAQAVVAGSTVVSGAAGLMGWVQTWASFLAVIVGLLLSLVLLVINLIKLGRMLKQKEAT